MDRYVSPYVPVRSRLLPFEQANNITAIICPPWRTVKFNFFLNKILLTNGNATDISAGQEVRDKTLGIYQTMCYNTGLVVGLITFCLLESICRVNYHFYVGC